MFTCVVCEDVSTGVPSCNGCKTFFRRAVVNNRKFTCISNKSCFVNKGVRSTCRYCRLKKCLEVGMDKNAIQAERDRIGYTKRTRKSAKTDIPIETDSPTNNDTNNNNNSVTFNESEQVVIEPISDDEIGISYYPQTSIETSQQLAKTNAFESILDRLTQLENNFTLLLSRGIINPYASLDEAIREPSRFSKPINVKLTDPIVTPPKDKHQQSVPFWRSRIIALYSEKIITRHLAFRTPELLNSGVAESNILKVLNTQMMTKSATDIKSCKAICQISAPLMCTSSSPNSNLTVGSKSPVCTEGIPISTLPSSSKREVPIGLELLEKKIKCEIIDETYTSAKNAGTPSITITSPQHNNIHTFFDPIFTRDTSSHNTTSTYSNTSSVSSGESRSSGPTAKVYPSCVGSLSGLTPIMAAMIDSVMKPFRRLMISTTEFAVLQAIMFFDPDTEQLDSASQRNVSAEQKKFISALHKHILSKYDSEQAEKRFSSILLRIPMIRKIAAKKNESLQIIDLFNLFTLNSLVKETIGIKNTSTSA